MKGFFMSNWFKKRLRPYRTVRPKKLLFHERRISRSMIFRLKALWNGYFQHILRHIDMFGTTARLEFGVGQHLKLWSISKRTILKRWLWREHSLIQMDK